MNQLLPSARTFTDVENSASPVSRFAAAGSQIDGETTIAYGDVLFRRYILDGLMTSKANIVWAADASNLHDRDLDDWGRVTANLADARNFA